MTCQATYSPGAVPKETLRGLAQFLMLTQEPSGMFPSYYSLNGTAPKTSVLYYPGEAMLALMHYYTLTGDEKALEAVKKGANYLIESQRQASTLPLDAWFMQALEALYMYVPEARYREHTLALAERIMATQYGDDAQDSYRGGFGPGVPRATPASARTEGMVAAYRLADATYDPRTKAIAASILASLNFQLGYQYTPDSKDVADPAMAAGGVHGSAESPIVRIDYVQHHISSLLYAVAAFDHDKKQTTEVNR